MKKILNTFFVSLLLLLIAFSVFKQNVSAQTDAVEDVVVECVTFSPTSGYGKWPDNVEGGTFTGTCSAKTKCDIITCLPGTGCVPNNGFVKLNSGNNFFSPGDINEAGTLNNIQDHTGYYIYAAHTPEPLGKGVDGENTTQQQAQATLVFPAGAENCTQIYWDPYGRVFDAVSLEPFSAGQATVTLLDEKGNPSANTFVNNVLIDEMGKYNIRINKDGNYKLNVTPKTNHSFTAGIPNPKYKDLYEFIYKLGDPAFVEIAKSPKRVDVALTPKGTPYSRSPDYISREYIDVWYDGAAYTKIALRTVHPKTIVKVMVNGVEITEDGNGKALPKTSDKEGYWLALIKKDILSQNGFSIELIKNPQYYPLTQGSTGFIGQIMDKLLSLFVQNVSAQQSIKINDPVSPTPKASGSTTVIQFEPILEYIEGYSYDDASKIVPKARVNIKLKANNKIYSTTTTDDSGFFTLYPKDLPPYEYYLEIVNPETGKASIQTTSKFVEKNQAYLDSEKIDLMKVTKLDQKIIDPVTGKLNEIDKNYVSPQKNDQASKAASTKSTAFDPAILMIVLVIALLVVVTMGLVYYIKRSKSF
ncbi:MAG: hypothetical protein NUV87_01030 [Candidatus Roizmanbacteria bacterium]|nr:hypothetical protein [Candidatus Roizmanbacteria bacterium]